VLRCGFVRYDDDRYITENPRIKAGLTVDSAARAFTEPHYHMWHPLTTLSYLLDYELAGLNPLWYHLVNLIFHVANTLLLFCVLRELTGAFWPSAFVAAVFAVHPLQVESVAWVAERKNVLSGFFWLLTMGAYLRYANRPGILRYLLVITCLALGLMTKPTVVMLPFALLLLDYWPLDRIRRGGESESSARALRPQYSAPLLLAEKAPMLVLAAAVAVITYLSQQAGGVVSELVSMPAAYRLANASIAYFTYIEKLFWPSGLAVFYPHPGAGFSVPRLAVSISVLALISACCLYFGRRRRYLLAGWLWYLGTLVPVIGFIQAGAQARANRYMYITMIGLLVIVAWGLNDLLRRWPLRPAVPVASAVVVVSAAVVCTLLQLQYWQNSLTLFKRAVDVTDNNYIMHNNYANRLQDTGKVDEAIEHFSKSLLIKPDSHEAHNNLGNALMKKGQTEKAIAHYEEAIALAQNKKRSGRQARGLAEAHHNLANALRLQTQLGKAAEHYSASLELRPNNLATLGALGPTLTSLGRHDDAIVCFKKILEIDPEDVFTHGRLGMALGQKGDSAAAADQFRFVLSRRPNDLEMYCNLGIVLEQQGIIDEAIIGYRRALQINPDYVKAKKLLQAALEKQQKR